MTWNEWKIEVEKQLTELGLDGSVEIAWIDVAGFSPVVTVDSANEITISD